MIVVIADDLSGAAELAGAAANLGMRAEVHTAFDARARADLVAVDTDTRSRSANEATRVVAGVARVVLAAKPTWIYKKTDSVLRGNVRAEVEVILAVTGQARVLLVPANPSKQRIIREGIYYVEGTPLAETVFARDPEHPRRSSRVSELLGLTSVDAGIFVPDVTVAQDLAAHAREVSADTLPAGGVDFFEALLKLKSAAPLREVIFTDGKKPTDALPTDASERTLFVCGSAAAWDNGRAEECIARGIPLLVMPESMFHGGSGPAAIAEWSADVLSALGKGGQAMLAIGRVSQNQSPLLPRELIARLIEAVARVLAAQPVNRILLEGGATAAALLQRMNWTRLSALPTDLTGVAALRPPGGPLLLIKPGSYPWPAAVFYNCVI